MTSTEQSVPRWADRAAHLAALTTLPSGLWRIPLALGFSMGMTEEHAAVHVGGWESVYVLSLSVVAESAALLTLGLVRPWGERVPSWFPRIGGRCIPPYAVIVPAALGAVVLALIWGYAFRDGISLHGVGFTHPAWHALLVACYLPLLLWAPLLGVLTWAYWRRRRPARGRSYASWAATCR